MADEIILSLEDESTVTVSASVLSLNTGEKSPGHVLNKFKRTFNTPSGQAVVQFTPVYTPPPSPPSTLTILTKEFPPAVEGVAYTTTLEASGGTPPYSWVNEGGLADGLHIDASTGVVSGTVDFPPTTYTAQIQVTDSAGATATAAIPMVVSPGAAPPPPPNGPNLPADLLSLINDTTTELDTDWTKGDPGWGDLWVNNWFGGGEFNGVTVFDSANIEFTDQGVLLNVSDGGHIGAMINSNPGGGCNPGFMMTYGYAQATCIIPAGSAWFTFWLASQNDPAGGGETDVVELLGSPNSVWTSNYHTTASDSENSGQIPGDWAGVEVTYGVIRQPGKNTIVWNGEVVKEYNTDDTGGPVYLLLSNGSPSGGTGPTIVSRVTVWPLA